MKPIIEVNNLYVDYGQNNILNDISFAVSKGDFVGVAGPNGAGKSTLIKALLGLVSKQHGTIKLFGIDTEKFTDWQRVGYLPQKISNTNSLFPASVEEVVTLGLLAQKKFPKMITAGDRKKVARILDELAISNLKDKMMSLLSGGQAQRVMLARTLVSDPEILIFDEPSTALDPESRDEFFNVVKKLNEQGTTIILITHDTGFIGGFANKLLYIDRKLIHYGAINDFCCHEDELGHHFEKSHGHIIWHQHK